MDENLESVAPDHQQIDDVSGTAEQSRPIWADKLLSAVANEQRRTILSALRRATDQTLEFDTLVDSVAESLRDESTVGTSDEHHQRLRIELHHTHLPKLDEVRIIDYETETGHVQFVGGDLEEDLLTLLRSHKVNG